MKLWSKNNDSSSATTNAIEKFTVGNDREFDLLLAPFDVIGNIAHAKMLATVGLLTHEEANALTAELKNIYKNIDVSSFEIEQDIEDIHSQIEFLLTKKLMILLLKLNKVLKTFIRK